LDLEELRLDALVGLLACPGLHRGAAGVGLEAAEVAAAAERAAAAHHDVPDLARGPAAAPDLAVEDDPAPDAATAPDADQGGERAARAGAMLADHPGAHVVREQRAVDADALRNLLGEVVGALEAREVRGGEQGRAVLVDLAGRAQAERGGVAGL